MAEYTQQDAAQHKCPGCGAPLKFDPASGNLTCEHCGNVVEFEKNENVEERAFEELVTFQTVPEGEATCFRCSNCGAVTVVPRSSIATSCPYCQSPLVLEDVTGTFVKPNTIVPFEVTRRQAAYHLSAWRKKRLFAPMKFRKHVKEDAIQGVFVPAWTFDAKTTATYSGSVGYHRTRTVRRNGKTYTETYTEWRHVSGVLDRDFDDITIQANRHVPSNYFFKLRPKDQSKYKVYDDEYLAGYIAHHYSVDPFDAFDIAQHKMKDQVRNDVVVIHNADVEGNIDVNLHFHEKTFKYLLVPVYIASTKFKGKTYTQYVSGVNFGGKKPCRVEGKFPLSPWKVALAVALGVGVFALMMWFMFVHGEMEISFGALNIAKNLLL